VVPEGATNFGFIGQFVEVPRDIMFTIEYSARTAWEAIHRLLRRGPVPPPVYQGQYHPSALFAALKTLARHHWPALDQRRSCARARKLDRATLQCDVTTA
jgi:myosin-crossreactive antigen